MIKSELFVGRPLMVPNYRHVMVETTITKIGRLYVTTADGNRWKIENGWRGDGFGTGRAFTLDGWVDHLDRSNNVKALRAAGIELRGGFERDWTNAQIKALESAVATIRETVSERDR